MISLPVWPKNGGCRPRSPRLPSKSSTLIGRSGRAVSQPQPQMVLVDGAGAWIGRAMGNSVTRPLEKRRLAHELLGHLPGVFARIVDDLLDLGQGSPIIAPANYSELPGWTLGEPSGWKDRRDSNEGNLRALA